jgi:hypothetical protein
VNFQNKKSNRTRSAFWIMKMSSNPSPLSEAIAPAPSRRPFCRRSRAVARILLEHDSSPCSVAPRTSQPPSGRMFHIPDHAVRLRLKRWRERSGYALDDPSPTRTTGGQQLLCQPLCRHTDTPHACCQSRNRRQQVTPLPQPSTPMWRSGAGAPGARLSNPKE